jgi:hypothetical protein
VFAVNQPAKPLNLIGEHRRRSGLSFAARDYGVNRRPTRTDKNRSRHEELTEAAKVNRLPRHKSMMTPNTIVTRSAAQLD